MTRQPRDALTAGGAVLDQLTDPALVARLARFAVAASVFAAALGGLALLGWLFDVDTFRRLIPTALATTKPFTALGLAIGGSAVALSAARNRRRLLASTLAAGVAILGLIVLGEYVLGLGTEFDDLLFADRLRVVDPAGSGRMAIPTALGFVMVGASVLLPRHGLLGYLGSSAALVGIALGCVPLLGYAFGERSLYALGPISISPVTALGIVAAAAGSAAAKPETGPLKILTRTTAGGLLARRFLPAALALPVILGWLRLAGQEAGFYGTSFGVAILVGATITGFIVLVGWTAWSIDRLEVANKAAVEQRRRAEAELRQAQRLESVGQLAGGIAHDFNNLIAVILNYASFVADQLADRPQLLEDVNEITHAAERAAALTRQLLIFARREIARPELVDINSVVTDMRKLLDRTIGEHIEFSTQLAPTLPAVMADRSQVEQVLMNLAVNARDAMPHGGRLVIATTNAELTEDYIASRIELKPGRYARLVVTDTGVGMTPEVAERAFEPFFTTKPKGQGTGLGLATVYGIVTEAGGNVTIYSEPGRGTSLSVYLPAAGDEAKPRADAAAPEDLRGSGERLLVVEDDAAVRAATVRVLAQYAYTVSEADRPSAALALVEHQASAIDLVITDVVLPEMSGIVLAERLRQLRPNLRVLFVSGYPLGAHDAGRSPETLVEKPYTREQLLLAIRRALSW